MAHILVLEDDEVSARLVAHMLRKQGHQPRTTARSAEAFQLLDQNPADLLILDTELIGEHGWEVLERLRRDIIFGGLPVLVYSTDSRRSVVERYLALGVQGILVKPYSAERLSRAVDRVMANPWLDQLFEPAEIMQARTGLTSKGVAELYRDAAAEIEASASELAKLREDPADVVGLARLTALKSCAVNIGYLLLERIVDEARLAASSDAARMAALLDRLPVARRLLESKAATPAVPEISAEIGPPAPAPADEEAAAEEDAPAVEVVVESAQTDDDAARVASAKPVN